MTGGHIDDAATVARLVALHANTYDYLVEQPNDWVDLPGFLSAAQTSGIQVFAYLLPPTECPHSTGGSTCDTYAPDAADYPQWGADLNALHGVHPNLVAWTIDDMDSGANTALFTPSYVATIRASAPDLQFFLQFYQPSMTAAKIATYAGHADGVIMPYRDGAQADTVTTDTLQSEVAADTALLNPYGMRLIVMVYGDTLGSDAATSTAELPPDTGYVRTVTAQAWADVKAGTIAGVIVWKQALATPGVPAYRSAALSSWGNGVLDFTIGPKVGTTAGDFAQAAAKVTLDPGSTSCTLALSRRDDRDTTAPSGYHQKRAYVNGTLVWNSDVASEGTDWYSSSPLDLTPYLSGGSATLALQLFENAGVSNYRTHVDFDNLRLTGCSVPDPGFETGAGWTLTHSADGVVHGTVYHYSPTFTTDTFSALADVFAS
ncbi:hypothetical protein [Streptacidiphilus cavernicola]|uniref:Uncharacterized protein n=1 Tax=Streptacidiphilus cavernicola TaxID=3342716 RepID=A0ABV6W3J3_9ACTN